MRDEAVLMRDESDDDAPSHREKRDEPLEAGHIHLTSIPMLNIVASNAVRRPKRAADS